jgi:hypothetical protein
VGIQGAERDAPRGRAERGQLPVDEAHHAHHLAGVDGVGDGAQRAVDRDQRDAQAAADEEHGDVH